MASSCDSEFSLKVIEAVGAYAAGASAVCLLQCTNSVGKARSQLLGSLLKLKAGGWAYIPLEESSVVLKKGAVCVVVRPSSGQPAKEVPVLDIGKTASGIIPGVLSSHLNPSARTFTEANLAYTVRSTKFGEDTVTRLVVRPKADGKLELCSAKEGGNDEPDKFADLDDLLEGINRGLLRPVRADEEPPRIETVTQEFGDVQLEDWVIYAVSRQYRLERSELAG
jgi:hypothetical protein